MTYRGYYITVRMDMPYNPGFVFLAIIKAGKQLNQMLSTREIDMRMQETEREITTILDRMIEQFEKSEKEAAA